MSRSPGAVGWDRGDPVIQGDRGSGLSLLSHPTPLVLPEVLVLSFV